MVRQRVAVALDVLVVALLVLLAVIIDLDGFILRVAGVRISFRSVNNPLAWFAVVACLRLVLFKSRGLVGYLPALWRRLCQVRVEADPVARPVAPGFWRRTLLASLGIGAVVAVLLHDQFLNPYSVPDWGDPLFSIWRIDQVLRRLLSDPATCSTATSSLPSA